MKSTRLPSLLLALVLQVLPVTRVFLVNSPIASSSFALVSTWVAGLAALLGSYNAVSGASTSITSAATARGTNGAAFSYRITTGPDTANRFSAVPLPTGLTCSTTTGRITGTPTQEGLFTVLLTASDNGSPSRTVTKNLALTIAAGGAPTNPPSITAQPASLTATNGGAATFAVVATGSAPLRYQWRLNGGSLAGATNATLSLSGLSTNQAGSYRVVVTNSVGSVTSNPAILSVNPAPVPPTLSTQPASLTVTAGSNATFAVVAEGTAPLAYQWRKDGAALAGAIGTTLTITGVQTTHSGGYTVIVSNPGGAVTSVVATLTVEAPVLPDTVRPTVRILQPTITFTRSLASAVVISGTAQDNQRLATVEVQQGSNSFATAVGTTNWTASLTLAPGTNLLRIVATDIAGNRSTTNSLTFYYAAMTPLALGTNGLGAVAGLTNQQLLEIGRSYSAQATAKPGHSFSNWIIGGQSVVGPKVSFVMTSNLSVIANFVPNPWTSLRGSYSGLFHPETGTPPLERSGIFTLAVTEKGTFSAKLSLDGATVPVSGTIGLDLAAQKSVVLRGTNALLLRLQFSHGSTHVSGYVSNALWVSELFGYRAPFHAKTNPATPYSGSYTMALSGSDDPVARPFGLGFASLAAASSGSVLVKSVLADGTPGVIKGALAANGQLPIYLNLYKGKGFLFGWLTFTDTETNDIPGLLVWTKNNGVPGSLYPSGFTTEARTLASRYTPPAKGVAVADFSDAIVLLEGGNLTSPLTNEVHLSSLNVISITSTQAAKLALTVASPSGLLNGRFIHPQSGSTTLIKGVVLQKQAVGGGFFPGLNQSGRVFLGRPEDSFVLSPE